MSSLKIFHTSDVHLGMKFDSYREVQKQLVEARFATLASMVEIANENHCHLFVIAGDLFDRTGIPKAQMKKAADILNQFHGGPCLILPGNHDFVTTNEKDIWQQMAGYTESHVIYLTELEPYSLHDWDLDVCIYPAPCDKKHSPQNLLEWIYQSGKQESYLYHIGIAHGSLQGFSIDLEGVYFPMQTQELLRCDLDLWLLGHTHIQYPTSEQGDKIFYPATPEPDGFHCNHSGKAWILEINEKKEVKSHSIETGTYRFYDYKNSNHITYKNYKQLENFFSEFSKPEHSLLRLQLEGSVSADDLEKLKKLRQKMTESFLLLQMDISRLKSKINKKKIEAEFNKDSFAYRLLNECGESGSEQMDLVYQLLMRAKI